MMSFNQKFIETVKEYNMLSEGESVLCGLSGGADSVSLVTALCDLKEELKISRIAAVHINHSLRDTADRDEIFAKELCEKLGIEFFAVKADIKKIAKEKGLSEEEAGRNVRYEAFFEFKKKLGIDKIATAHTKDDVAETFFIRLLRGSSLDGLYGIKYVREDGVIRPILKMTKSEILDYLKEKNQPYVTDETNFTDDYLRNHIRLNLIPYLKENYNPEIINDIFRTSQLFSRDMEYIKKNTEAEFERIVKFENGNITINISSILELDYAVSSRIINKCFGIISKENLCYVHISSIFELIKKGKTGKTIDLPGDTVAEISYGNLIIRKTKEQASYCYPLKTGEINIKEANRSFVVEKGLENGKNVFTIEADEIDNYQIRSFVPGDRIHIKKVGTKKIKDIFIDKKIPRAERLVYPIVTFNGQPVWLPGMYKNQQPEFENPLSIKYKENEYEQ